MSQVISFRTDLKKDWLQFCQECEIDSNDALRQLIQKVLTNKTGFDQLLNIPKGVLPKPENGTHKNRIEIRFTNKEYEKVIEHAKQSGFSPAKWLITLARYQFIRHTPLTVMELDKIDDRLYQIRMIGQNLNQLLRSLNNHELHPSQMDIMPLLESLVRNIEEEKKTLNLIVSNNLERW